MVVGSLPFDAPTFSDLSVKVQKCQVYYPSHLSSSLKNLLESILNLNANRRPSIQFFLCHSWVSPSHMMKPFDYILWPKTSSKDAMINKEWIEEFMTLGVMNAGKVLMKTVIKDGSISSEPIVCPPLPSSSTLTSHPEKKLRRGEGSDITLVDIDIPVDIGISNNDTVNTVNNHSKNNPKNENNIKSISTPPSSYSRHYYYSNPMTSPQPNIYVGNTNTTSSIVTTTTPKIMRSCKTKKPLKYHSSWVSQLYQKMIGFFDNL